MPYRNTRLTRDYVAPLGFADLWSASPLPTAVFGPTVHFAAKLILVISTIAYVWAFPRNLGVANGVIALQVLALLVLGLLSSERIALHGKLRLSLLCITIAFMGMLAHHRNEQVLASLFSVFPIATLLTVAFGPRKGLAFTVLVHAAFFAQALVIGAQDMGTISVYISISFLWSIMVASFISVLLSRIERDFDRIGSLLEAQHRTLGIIGNELRVPAMTLSMLSQRTQPTEEELVNMRDSAEQMLMVIDNLRRSESDDFSRPIDSKPLPIAPMTRRLASQLTPVMQRLGLELLVDVHPTADLVVSTDGFRVRTILSNLIRTDAARSDGFRVWLNVSAQTIADGEVKLVFEVEDNGHRSSVDSALNDPEQDGTWVAKTWVEQLDGQLECFDSPRGGHGYRVTLTAPTVDLDAVMFEHEAAADFIWQGMTALVYAPDYQRTHVLTGELMTLGLHVEGRILDAETLASPWVNIDLVVMDGSEHPASVQTALEEARGRGEQLPIIAILNEDQKIPKAQLLDKGVSVVLTNPIGQYDLNAAMQSLVVMGQLRRGEA